VSCSLTQYGHLSEAALERTVCTCLTKLYLIVGVYIVFLLHKVQLHVSAPDNGHLQVVNEILSKQLYKLIWAIYIGRVGDLLGGHEISCMSEVWVLGGNLLLYVTTKLI
jgi:hypothetical protein